MFVCKDSDIMNENIDATLRKGEKKIEEIRQKLKELNKSSSLRNMTLDTNDYSVY